MMPKENKEVLIDKVKNENIEFRALYLEHLELEKKLLELNKSKYLTPEGDIERKRLQKLKLLGKDKMAKILKEYERQ